MPPMNGAATSPGDMAVGAAMGETPVRPGWIMRGLAASSWARPIETSRVSLSGWTDASFTASSSRSDNRPVGFNDGANKFLLQQHWLRIDRALDERRDRPSWGFRSDWLFGSDYRYTLPRGIFNAQLTADDGKPARYGFDPVQFYVAFRFPRFFDGLDIKVGRFSMIHGVEMNEAPANLLASHNYIYPANPFTHTGLLTTTRLTQRWTLQAGITTGSDVFIDPAASATFVGGLRWTAGDRRTSVAAFAVAGSGRYDIREGFDNRRLFDLVLYRQLTKRLIYTAEAAFGYQKNVPALGTAQWFGVVQYLTYAFAARASWTTRVEVFDDVQGQRTGFSGLYAAITSGVNYQPVAWFILRPELRFDRNSQSRPFGGEHHLFTATLDLIQRW